MFTRMQVPTKTRRASELQELELWAVDWNKIASSDILWKKLCVKRWVFCEDVTPQLLGTETWKQFFHYKIWQEHTKSREKPEDFTYKEIHMKTTGFREHACYLSGCGLTRNQQDRSVVCIANPKAQISARDIHEDREDGEPQPKQLREEEEEHRELRLQNYVPEDEDLKRCQVPQAKPVAVEEKVKEQLEAAKPEPVIEEVDLANLAPWKPDWDLKRDVAKKLEKLEKQTQSAIAELIRERLKGQEDSLASAVAANIETEACDSD
ncbi:uncharacterized protein LOC117693684 isoform X2 [Arvicanthis niloticus]|uniref:uncharacterized protein LOC117693684 isoform X2 n=1 Tax=Arvicanthis niloticus TaxID=61156 RepID=UPI00402B9BA7